MINFKTISGIPLTIALSALASTASAQSTPAPETAQPVLTQPASTVKSAEAEHQLLPATRKIKRVVKHVPVPAAATPQQKSVYSGVINADASEQKTPTRFIYTRRKTDTAMPVYFNAESMTSR